LCEKIAELFLEEGILDLSGKLHRGWTGGVRVIQYPQFLMRGKL